MGSPPKGGGKSTLLRLAVLTVKQPSHTARAQDNHIERLFRFLSTRTTTVLGGTLALHMNTVSVKLSDCADDDPENKTTKRASGNI